MSLNYFSMFSGIGGFEYGIEKFNDAKCSGYSEINKYASAIYRYHYPNHKNYGNAKELVPESLPDFELLVGGFPCQAFSNIGKRQGFRDTRGTLFFDVARVLEAKRPEWLLLENVKGLCSHGGGETLATIYGVLTDLGYTVGWEVVNSVQFGVPQKRERIFIVGHLGEAGGCVREILPVRPAKDQTTRADIPGNGLFVNSIDASYYKGVDKHAQRTLIAENMTVFPHQYEFNEWDEEYDPICPNHDVPFGECDCLGIHSELDFVKLRMLTPIECERLQGFPDNWTKYGIIDGEKVEISDTQRYKALGNAVTTNVVEAFAKKLFGHE